MTDAEAVQLMCAHFEGLFPRSCSKCQAHFATVRDFIRRTQRVGPVISYDVELRDWEPENPLGAFASVNCTCGTTLALSTAGMPVPKIHAVLHWVKTATERRGVTPEQLIDWVRDEIRKQVLAEPEPGTQP